MLMLIQIYFCTITYCQHSFWCAARIFLQFVNKERYFCALQCHNLTKTITDCSAVGLPALHYVRGEAFDFWLIIMVRKSYDRLYQLCQNSAAPLSCN